MYCSDMGWYCTLNYLLYMVYFPRSDERLGALYHLSERCTHPLICVVILYACRLASTMAGVNSKYIIWYIHCILYSSFQKSTNMVSVELRSKTLSCHICCPERRDATIKRNVEVEGESAAYRSIGICEERSMLHEPCQSLS